MPRILLPQDTFWQTTIQPSRDKLRWNVIRQAPNGLYYVYYLDINNTDNGSTIFQKLGASANLFILPNLRCGRWSVSMSDYVVYAVTATQVRAQLYLFRHQ